MSYLSNLIVNAIRPIGVKRAMLLLHASTYRPPRTIDLLLMLMQVNKFVISAGNHRVAGSWANDVTAAWPTVSKQVT